MRAPCARSSTPQPRQTPWPGGVGEGFCGWAGAGSGRWQASVARRQDKGSAPGGCPQPRSARRPASRPSPAPSAPHPHPHLLDDDRRRRLALGLRRERALEHAAERATAELLAQRQVGLLRGGGGGGLGSAAAQGRRRARARAALLAAPPPPAPPPTLDTPPPRPRYCNPHQSPPPSPYLVDRALPLLLHLGGKVVVVEPRQHAWGQ
jgi:hypothetical protein